MHSPLVSVVIPHYNHAAFIAEAVNSVLQQTWENVEIIIVDDGSTDEQSKKAINNFSAPKTQLLFQKNTGVSTARNNGIAAAKGIYIVLLDADDTIENTFIEKAFAAFGANSDLGIVTARSRYIGEKTGDAKRMQCTLENILLAKSHLVFSMFKKEDWEKTTGFDPHLKVYEDMDFWLSIIELGKTVYQIDEVLLNYRQHRESTTAELRRDGGHGIVYPDYEPLVYIFQKHQALYLQYPQIIVKKIFGERTKPQKILSKRLKYKLILLAANIPLFGKLLAHRAQKAKDQLHYLSHF